MCGYNVCVISNLLHILNCNIQGSPYAIMKYLLKINVNINPNNEKPHF